MDSRPEIWQHINTVRRYLNKGIHSLLRRSVEHDMSKLSSPEIECFDKEMPLLKTLKYLSPEYKESVARLAPALSHHYAVNRHHPEFFAVRTDGGVDQDEVKSGRAIRHMTLLDLFEMLCDWKAAGEQTAGGSLENSLAKNRERFGMSDEMVQLLRNTFQEIE